VLPKGISRTLSVCTLLGQSTIGHNNNNNWLPTHSVSTHARPLQKRLKRQRRRLLRLLHQPRHLPEPTTASANIPPLHEHPYKPQYSLRNLGIPHHLIHPTLARRDHRALAPHPLQRNRHLLPITTRHPIRDDVNPVPRSQQVETGLQHAYVALYPDQRNGLLPTVAVLVEARAELGRHHAEEGLVQDPNIRQERVELRDQGAEF